MRLNRSLPILWIPLIALWTFLGSIHLNRSSLILDDLVPTISYFLVSFLLVLQLQFVIGGRTEGAFVKFGSINIISLCLLISTITILLSITGNIPVDLAVILLISSLLINTILAELLSYTNQKVTGEISRKRKAWAEKTEVFVNQQKQASFNSSRERRKSIESREAWRVYLNQASIEYTNNHEIIDEISRVKDIIAYSSYFRSMKSMDDLSILKSTDDENKMIFLLKGIK